MSAERTVTPRGKRAIALGAIVLCSVVGAGAVLVRHHEEMRRGGGPRVATPNAGKDRDDNGPNAGKRSVLEALASGKHPERLSPLIAPAPFDKSAYDANPQAYLDVVEPGRCFQTAKAVGGDAIQLIAVGSSAPRALPGETVPLIAQGARNAPVTFTAFDGGLFTENGLGSVTVKGDVHGYATVHFTAPINARGHLAVLAGSPLAVGNQRFFVDLQSLTAMER